MEPSPKNRRQEPHDGGGDGGATVDRLSTLPENIIVAILNLLPLKTAVSTSVLSRRWRHRWTQVTTLTLSNFAVQNPNPNPNPDPFAFFPLIDHLFLHLTSPDIHAFKFSVIDHGGILWFRYGSRFRSHMKTWLHFLLFRNVKVIEFRDLVSCFWLRLLTPSVLFTSSTLVELNLSARFDFDPLPDEFNLPNLRKLEFILDKNHVDLLSKLFTGCPRLEELRLRLIFRDESSLIRINSASLKSIVIKLDSEILFAVDVLIDAPNVEHLNISSDLVRYHFGSDHMALVKAIVDFAKYDDDDDDDDDDDFMLFMGPILGLLQGVSNARSLCCESSLIPCVLSWMEGLCLPTFHNLTCLSLALCCRKSWCVMWGLLRHSPKLEVLSVRMSEERYCREDTRRNTLNSATVYSPDSLKRVHFMNLGLSDNELELITDILGYLKNLELLTLALHKARQLSKEMQLCKELDFCGKLLKFPKCSLGCQICFDGTYIKISEEGIKIGELGTCVLQQ